MVELSKIVLPKASYKFRVIEAARGVSASSGNPKADVDLEIIDSPHITVMNDEGVPETVSPNGLRIRTWLTFVPQSLGSTNKFIRAVGLPKIEEKDLMTFDVNLLKGKIGYGIASGMLKNNVDSSGQPIINPHTGKPAQLIDNKFTEFFLP